MQMPPHTHTLLLVSPCPAGGRHSDWVAEPRVVSSTRCDQLQQVGEGCGAPCPRPARCDAAATDLGPLGGPVPCGPGRAAARSPRQGRHGKHNRHPADDACRMRLHQAPHHGSRRAFASRPSRCLHLHRPACEPRAPSFTRRELYRCAGRDPPHGIRASAPHLHYNAGAAGASTSHAAAHELRRRDFKQASEAPGATSLRHPRGVKVGHPAQ